MRGEWITPLALQRRRFILKGFGVEFISLRAHYHMMSIHKVAWILIIIGGLNWLLVGLGGFMGGNWNLVNLILGSWPMLEWLVYILVGAAAVYEIVTHRKNCKECSVSAAM